MMPQAYKDLWKGRSGERRSEYQWVWEKLNPPPASVIDVGCVESNFAIVLSEMGYDVWGIDIRQYGLKHPNFTFMRIDLFNFDSQEKYDYAISISTLEHLHSNHYGEQQFNFNWLEGLRCLYNLVKPLGNVLATMPYGEQIDGFDWIQTPTIRELSYVDSIFPIVEFDYYGNVDGEWRKLFEPTARKIKGNKKGFPNAIVCIKLSKPLYLPDDKIRTLIPESEIRI